MGWAQRRHEALRIGKHQDITQDVKVRLVPLYGVRRLEPHASSVDTNNFSSDLQHKELRSEDEVLNLLMDGVLGNVAAEVLVVPCQPALSKPIINRDVFTGVYGELVLLHVYNAHCEGSLLLLLHHLLFLLEVGRCLPFSPRFSQCS